MKSSTSRVNGTTSPKFKRPTVFTKEEESHLKSRLIEASNTYCKITPKICRKIAFSVAEKAQLPNPFNSDKKQAGYK